MQLSKHHRIIRRGRKYRELAESSTPGNLQCNDQGILFIALNADLRRQFEFVQQTWLNSPTFQGLDNDKDPIVGDNDGSAAFTVRDKPCNQRVRGLPRFVTGRGGGSVFLSGSRA